MNIDLTLMNRDKNKKERIQNVSKVTQFSHEDIKNHFRENIESIKNSFEILEDNNLNEDHKQNILRSQIMFLDSALDFYMHEITKYGMKKMYDGQWDRTEKYLNVKINLDDMHIIEDENAKDFFNDIINKSISSETFMSATSIMNQFKLLGFNIDNILNVAFYKSGDNVSTREKFKVLINGLYNRRNKIAHQSDRNPANSEKSSIDREFVEKNIDIVIKFVSAIDTEIIRKDEEI
ncbi:HEPN domain-containing protein [uncultured Fusobacterium sp.]|uniref:HEPN domain-containing protein n=1 Tax=uncultured Fusobacterium sp. TaxID=159267 RepID=UPI0025D39A94|nr:HEPN domain-containing protein [uncultured Fusobacterium sp.]